MPITDVRCQMSQAVLSVIYSIWLQHTGWEQWDDAPPLRARHISPIFWSPALSESLSCLRCWMSTGTGDITITCYIHTIMMYLINSIHKGCEFMDGPPDGKPQKQGGVHSLQQPNICWLKTLWIATSSPPILLATFCHTSYYCMPIPTHHLSLYTTNLYAHMSVLEIMRKPFNYRVSCTHTGACD